MELPQHICPFTNSITFGFLATMNKTSIESHVQICMWMINISHLCKCSGQVFTMDKQLFFSSHLVTWESRLLSFCGSLTTQGFEPLCFQPLERKGTCFYYSNPERTHHSLVCVLLVRSGQVATPRMQGSWEFSPTFSPFILWTGCMDFWWTHIC